MFRVSGLLYSEWSQVSQTKTPIVFKVKGKQLCEVKKKKKQALITNSSFLSSALIKCELRRSLPEALFSKKKHAVIRKILLHLVHLALGAESFT